MMAGLWTELLSFYNYTAENLECLLYSVELLAVNLSFFWAFFDLLVDISESFGVLVAASVVMTAYVATLFAIHSLASLIYTKVSSMSSSQFPKLLDLYKSFKNRF
jgi:hypothetical protein